MKNTVYILHGWAIDTENEKKWATFRDLLKKYSIQTVFLPLPGLTTKLETAWTLDDYIAWLEKELPKGEKAILLGHSFGGQIAARFAAQYPEKVTRLILIASAGMIDRAPQKVLKRMVFGFAAKVGKPILRHEVFRKVLYKLAREQDYLKANKTQRQTMANVINTEIIDYLPQIECPTLLIWGKNDTATPLKFAKVFQSEIEQSQLHIITNARHSPQFTHAIETAEVIGEFLK